MIYFPKLSDVNARGEGGGGWKPSYLFLYVAIS